MQPVRSSLMTARASRPAMNPTTIHENNPTPRTLGGRGRPIRTAAARPHPTILTHGSSAGAQANQEGRRDDDRDQGGLATPALDVEGAAQGPRDWRPRRPGLDRQQGGRAEPG